MSKVMTLTIANMSYWVLFYGLTHQKNKLFNAQCMRFNNIRAAINTFIYSVVEKY